ncbi:hypothetical protein F5Y00DRAFT_271676 [Daldinia vernicosa]|uniref:uncharacterized protein n=1 Tax=Daldinia vernicosa TaxID=114800 RepID=UPI002008D65E|nr:uncharacterized protein F5Y00DRAFT_271676 [Daldinia vernicosa]KAI0853240.1 hypothetical protein F5Y00DRAFT_271676 [Daldinia vernicosa]
MPSSLNIPKLPYFAPEKHLPAPLPDPESLREDQYPLDILRGVRVGKHYLARYGLDPVAGPLEAVNMLLVSKYTKVPIPTVYAAYWHEHHGVWSFVMVTEYVPGHTIREHVGNDEARLKPLVPSITEQLRRALAQLRRIPHAGFYGPVGDDPALRSKQFGTAAEVRNARFDEYIPEYPYEPDYESKRYMRRRAAAKKQFCKGLSTGDAPVFTHGRLDMWAIKVRPDGNICITNWRAAGFYPPEFEYMRAESMGQGYEVWNDILAAFPENASDERYDLIENIFHEYEDMMEVKHKRIMEELGETGLS